MTEESQMEQDLEKRIVEYLTPKTNAAQQKPKSVNQKTLIKYLNVEPQHVALAINALLRKGLIDLKTGSKTREVNISLKSNDKPQIKGENEKKVVYEIIRAAGNKGIWIREIINRSGLSQTVVQKMLKTLESEKLIKAVISVLASRKKCYMLYDLEPDTSITGGAWYTKDDFDHEFVEVINQQCYKYLYSKLVRAKAEDKNLLVQRQLASTTSEEVRNHISKLGISHEELSIQDVESILNTLVYDGKVETFVKMDASSSDSDTVNTYLCVESLVQTVGLMQVPCGLCPVISRCTENGEISPSTCCYLKSWLQF